MILKTLTIFGMSVYRDGHTWNFQKQQVLKGPNNVGKSTIAHAIAFCLYGVDTTGSNRDWDSAHNRETIRQWERTLALNPDADIPKPQFEVTMVVEIAGLDFELSRTHTYGGASKFRCPKGFSPTTLPDVDLFLVIFSPGLIWQMSIPKRRELIQKLVDTVDQNAFRAFYMETDPHPETSTLAELALTTQGGDIENAVAKLTKDIGVIRISTDLQHKLMASAQAVVDAFAEPALPDGPLLEQLAAELKEGEQIYADIEARLNNTDTTVCEACGSEISKACPPKEQAKYTKEILELTHTINATKQEYTKRSKQLESYTKGLEELQKNKQLVDAHKKKLDVLQKNSKMNTDAIALLKKFDKWAADRDSKSINDYMKKACLVLREPSKTKDTWKDVFKLTYDGLPYQRLSASSSKRADIEVAVALAKSLGQSMPVFIDNAECLTYKEGTIVYSSELDNVNQWFLAVASNNDTELSVTTIEVEHGRSEQLEPKYTAERAV